MTPLDSSPLDEPVIERAAVDALVPLSAYDRCVLALDACRRALAECRTTGDAREIRNRAAALETYAKAARDRSLQADAHEVHLRAGRRLGELIAEQKASVGLNTGRAGKGRPKSLGGSETEPPKQDDKPTLAEAGIDKKLSMRAQRLARLTEDAFCRLIDGDRTRIMAGRVRQPLDNLTGNVEWFTDPAWVERARTAMGSIDLDPASCEKAQRIVKAAEWFDKERDGLEQTWRGRNLWLNPPYGNNGLIDKFIEKLIAERPNYDQAIVLVNSQTETAWFQRLGKIADAIAFPKGRVYFYNERTKQQNPVFGSAFVYIGDRVDAFVDAFKRDCLILAGGLGARVIR